MITRAASFTVPGGMLSRPADFDRFREEIIFKISPFVTGLKTILSVSSTLVPRQL